MSPYPGHLHILCGKIAAGKSTLAGELGRQPATVVLSEDAWLAGLYGPEMATLKDYVRYSERLRSVLAPHAAALLAAGVSVVLDFPANTPDTRVWMRQLMEESGSTHTLHYLNVPDEVCRERLRQRNASGLHPFAVSDELFDTVTSYFVPPGEGEGFDIKEY